MSQQINLYEARLRPRHEVVTARNVGVCTLIVIALVTAFGVWAQLDARRKTESAGVVQKQLAAEQEKLGELAKVMAERKVSSALISERDGLKAVLAQRQEIMAILDSGRLGNTTGFSGVMTGFARQTPLDLWLTGFSVTLGGEAIEIHGRSLDPAKLPVYVQSLSSEPVFRGRRFAALDMRDVDPESPTANQTGSPATNPPAPKAADNGAQPVPTGKLPHFVEFVLRSDNVVASDMAHEGTAP